MSDDLKPVLPVRLPGGVPCLLRGPVFAVVIHHDDPERDGVVLSPEGAQGLSDDRLWPNLGSEDRGCNPGDLDLLLS